MNKETKEYVLQLVQEKIDELEDEIRNGEITDDEDEQDQLIDTLYRVEIKID